MVLRRIFGIKREKITGGLRKLHNEGNKHLYHSQSIIRVIKSRRMGWVGEMPTKFWSEKKRPLERSSHR
jgi:hypothetical protein